MTVSTELSHEEYTGNGVTTDFDFRFRIFEAKHLVVSVADQDGTERILTNGTDYTLRGVGSYRGGKVILKMPLATGWKIGIARDLPVVQETDLRNQGKFFAEVHEDAFDYLTMLIQKSLGFLSLCLRKPSFISDHYDAKGNKISNLGKPVKDGDAVDLATMNEHISAKDKRSLRVADNDIPVLPNAVNRANKLLSFDDDGNPVVIVPESGSAADVLAELGKPDGYKLIPSIESQLIPEIKKSYFMADALGITPDINDCATVINNLIQNGVRKILFPAGLYRFSSAIKVTDNTKIIDLSSNGVSVVGLSPHALPNPITNEYCVKNNIVIFYNEITDFFEGTCILDIKNIAFLGLVNDNSKNNRYNAHTCFKESGGSLYVKPSGCLFYKWGCGLDLKEMSHSKKIIGNKFQHCKIAVDLSGVVFNSFVEHNFFVENDIGVKLGSGSQVSVSDNEFALDAEHGTIGIVSDAMSGISFNRNYFEDYGDKSKPKYGIGALAYDIKFNPYVYSPDSISIFGNTINMQDRSDYCFRLDNFNRLLKLPLFDFTLSNNKSIGFIKSHVYIPNYSNLGLCLDGLTVTGDYYDARKKYNASFGEGGNRIGGNKGVSCEKLSTGKYRVTVEFGTGTGERLCSNVSPLINIPVFGVIEDTTPNTIMVAIFNMKGEPLDCPFMVSTSQ